MSRQRGRLCQTLGRHHLDAQIYNCTPTSLMLSMPQCLHIHSRPHVLKFFTGQANLQSMNEFDIININNLSLHCFNAVKCARCGSNDSTAKISVKSVCHYCSRLTFSSVLCTCLISLYIRPAVCIVTAI